jgi:hypothetical protein
VRHHGPPRPQIERGVLQCNEAMAAETDRVAGKAAEQVLPPAPAI